MNDLEQAQKEIEEAQKRLEAAQARIDKIKSKEPEFLVGALVEVGEAGNDRWYLRRLSRIAHNNRLPYKTSSEDGAIGYWAQCRPAYYSLMNWQKWEGGECPVNGEMPVITIRRDGSILAAIDSTGWGGWRHSVRQSHGDIIAYATFDKELIDRIMER